MIKFRDHQTARFWSRRLESVWRPNTWVRSQNFGLDFDPKAKISVSVLISLYGLGLGLDLKNSLSFLKASFNITGRRHDEGRDVGHRDGHLRPDGQVHDSGVSMTTFAAPRPRRRAQNNNTRSWWASTRSRPSTNTPPANTSNAFSRSEKN